MNTICFVVTHAMTVRLKLIGQLEAIHEAGFRPVIITSNGPDLLGVEGRFDVVDVGFLREISVFRDLRAFFRTLNALRRERPCIVNASTPKASLIGMVSAFIARVPVRIYTLRGIRYETLTGFKRFVVVVCERITALCAHRIIAVSRSVRDEYVRAGICSAKKIVVLGNGSSNGIEVRRFPTDAARTALGCNVRDALGFSHDAPVIGFVGRGTRDKGICELLDAFFFVRDVVPNVRLLIVGGFEAGDPLPREYMARIESNRAIRVVDFVQDTTP
ncbi:MAG: glycosyltransferase, partial [Planctomycetales bacterium]|nr:glycosyltransferase [Planctomycetales bacterium]